MADVQTPHGQVGITPAKKRYPQSFKKKKRTYCILCRKYTSKDEVQGHIHGMLHHIELDTVLGTHAFHDCHACQAFSMGLKEFGQHISTRQHRANLKSLKSRHVKPISLFKTLSPETITMILERNKTLTKNEKKVRKKKKKKVKQVAGQKRTEKLQRATRKKTEVPKQVQTKISKQMQESCHKGSTYAVVQNKENKVSSLQRPPHHTESALQNQSGGFACCSGEPAGRSWHHPQNLSTQSTQHLRFHDNFSVSTQCRKLKNEKPQTHRLSQRPHASQGVATDTPKQITWPAVSQYNYHNRQYSREANRDFTSDHLPQKGAIIFGHCQGESVGSSQPGQEASSCSSQPASANKSVDAAPVQCADVSAMLRQIRRALGVREPCRADREARKQKSVAGVQVTDCSAKQQAGTEIEPPVSTSFGTHVTSAPPTSVPSPPVKTTSSESNLYNSCRVRIAHKPAKAQLEKQPELNPTTNKLLSLPDARKKLNWKKMYNEMKRRKVPVMPRFGIEMVNRPPDLESSPQPPDGDLPLSEGFHWESFPDSPLGLHLTLPPPPRDTRQADCHTETQSGSEVQEPLEPLEQPGAARESYSGEAAREVSLKVEPNLEDENRDLRDNACPSKRKPTVVTDGVSDMEPSVKKKKTKSNKDQDQMDQLLAVSLREDELSRSLQDLDVSLVQARNALHAAYSDFQRLVLQRQQFTAEVNSLRAKRIEILQGMQEGYSGASNAAEKATTSSAGAAATVWPPSLPSSSAFSSSSSTQQLPATSPVPSITQPHPTPLSLPAASLKQEMCHLPTAGQAIHLHNTVSSNADAPQVPLNHPVPLFPANLLPSLLLRPPHLASPTAAAAQQPTAECSTSVGTLPPPESSARQQEQETREGLKDCVKTVTLAKEAKPAEWDSEAETGGNLSKGQVEGKESAADKSVPKREKHDEGNESDNSVEMIDPSNLEVINIDESDCEDSPKTVPNLPEPPQKSVSVEFSASSTQTFQENDADRKIQPSAMPLKDASAPEDCDEDEEPSLGAFVNHSGPVHGLQVHNGLLYTCSGDNTARAYSLANMECQAVFEGHTNKVNCLLVSSLPNMPTRLYTGSSDETIRCYSMKSKKCVEQITLQDRVLCLHIAWNILYAGLASGSVASYDLKTLKPLNVFECHGPRGVSCLGTAQEGARRLLLVGSYDSTISVRDAKSGLLLRSLAGHTKTVLCMKVVNDLVFSGSSDTSVHAHNIHTGELLRIYKGHGHAVTSIIILGKVMVTACLDKLVRVYELQSHDRLQVYGGHSDMVMCMVVHKSVIYTGCYDGSVQAVKLNLMKNYRCWWQNCSLIFGIPDHLAQHLINDHSNLNLQTCKCRWRDCSAFFASQQSVKQELPDHMQSHVDNDSMVQP